MGHFELIMYAEFDMIKYVQDTLAKCDGEFPKYHCQDTWDHALIMK